MGARSDKEHRYFNELCQLGERITELFPGALAIGAQHGHNIVGTAIALLEVLQPHGLDFEVFRERLAQAGEKPPPQPTRRRSRDSAIHPDDPHNPTADMPRPIENSKNRAAIMLGRLGGKKGGVARAARLSPERRREIAQQAARARWSKKRDTG